MAAGLVASVAGAERGAGAGSLGFVSSFTPRGIFHRHCGAGPGTAPRGGAVGPKMVIDKFVKGMSNFAELLDNKGGMKDVDALKTVSVRARLACPFLRSREPSETLDNLCFPLGSETSSLHCLALQHRCLHKHFSLR
jgi:hypothetical protein